MSGSKLTRGQLEKQRDAARVRIIELAAANERLKAALTQTAPGWTSKTPTAKGWYWFQIAPHLEPIIVCLHLDGHDPKSVDGYVMDFAGDERHRDSNKIGGIWAGPLSPPG